MISDTLKQKLKEKGQFPYGKRDRAYQSIAGEPGIRDMNHRFKVMNFPKSFDGETVIDFGCSAGAICLEAKKRGAKRVVGLDYKSETIDVAKSLARELNLDIEFYTFNIDDGMLLSHRAFWNYPSTLDQESTITEFIGLPDELKDGMYLLNLSMSNLKNDASPSRPVLFSIFY